MGEGGGLCVGWEGEIKRKKGGGGKKTKVGKRREGKRGEENERVGEIALTH